VSIQETTQLSVLPGAPRGLQFTWFFCEPPLVLFNQRVSQYHLGLDVRLREYKGLAQLYLRAGSTPQLLQGNLGGQLALPFMVGPRLAMALSHRELLL
jgi:hypothetical protein